MIENTHNLSSSLSHMLFCYHQHQSSRMCRPQSKDQAYPFEHLQCSPFDLPFCLVNAALPLCLPHTCFAPRLQLHSTTSNGMAYSIKYAPSRQRDRGGISLSFSLIFPFHCDWSAPPQRAAQHLLSPHLVVLHASSSLPLFFCSVSAVAQHCPLRCVWVLQSLFHQIVECTLIYCVTWWMLNPIILRFCLL